MFVSRDGSFSQTSKGISNNIRQSPQYFFSVKVSVGKQNAALTAGSFRQSQ